MTPFQRLFGSGPLILTQALALMVAAVWVQRSTGLARPPWPHAMGIVLGLVAVGLSVRFCRSTILALPLKDRGRDLKTTGPFAAVRHPLYAGVLAAIGSGTFLIGHTWFGLLSWALSYLGAHLLVGYEERLMRTQFGDAWIVYARRTPRFLFRIRSGTR
ncbi:MAG: isoprenylcysteine carboxylmethyltransferase family protein [Acidobacteria bacterium]|nr:isoprenylcysteine carboxylmethyltransferase family protein [Acidobacteriota bacterium]